jgi:putative ABC transport system substrate-binding protein
MRQGGYVERDALEIIRRAGEDDPGRLQAAAEELAAMPCDVIVAVATPAVAAAQKATATIPIVISPATDPVGSGFVNSYAHPGGNITGLANLVSDLTGKCVELVRALLPNARRVAVLMSSNSTHPMQYEVARAAADATALILVPVVAPRVADLEAAFRTIFEANCDAVLVVADPLRPAIVTLAAQARIPTIYQYSDFVLEGGLMSYGPNIPAIHRRSAHYVQRILAGERAADLPVEQPTAFELVINMNAASALGLAIPPTLLARADEVIE